MQKHQEQRDFGCLLRKREQADDERGEQHHGDAERVHGGIGDAHEQAGVVRGLFVVARAHTLTDDRDHRQTHRGAGNDLHGGNGVRHGICCESGGTEGGDQAGDEHLADLEHAVFQSVGHADGEGGTNHVAVEGEARRGGG